MRVLVLCASLSTLTVTSVRTEEARKVFHDGIEMAMSKAADNNGLEIVFGAEVPAHLREVGVTSGTMLVRGQWDENILSGEAWAFSKDCGPVSYPVRGVVDYGGSLVVFGPVPTCDRSSVSWGKEAVMRFDAPPPVTTSRPERERRKVKPRAEPKPKPKPAPRPRATPRPSYQQPYQQWPGYPQQWRW